MEIEINDQQLIELALFALCNLEDEELEDESPTGQIALNVLAQFVLQNNPELSQDEVFEKINEMETEYTLNSLVNKGMIDREFSDDGEIRYVATDKGRAVAQGDDYDID